MTTSIASFCIREPLFKTQPVFVLGCTAGEAEAFLLKRYRAKVSINSRAAGTMLRRDRFPYRIVWAKGYPNKPTAMSELMHEIFHLVTGICGDKGVPIHDRIETGECGDEAAAHLLEFFAYECFRRIRGRK